ncbi:MAG TPA: hypothetical protein VG963_04025 [Polyangiaceae bacterium]|nr:hypothetical protein [Polyangiaceae bacterium]HVZ31566.1 hypothetical protein [Polyangiaceae bacterium]
MPVPIVPLALGAGLALWTLYEKQHAKEAHGAGTPAAPVQALPPVALVPGAQAYLPPIAAPEPFEGTPATRCSCPRRRTKATTFDSGC